MNARPLLIDLFCKAGGAGMGYHRAGFDVIGVDIEPQPNYPFRFEQADALDWLREELTLAPELRAAAYHASPPCQGYSNAQRIQGREHPMLIDDVRDLLRATGAPYIIENVVGAPLIDPITLCGAMFGLGTYRHRLFECSPRIAAPSHPEHVARTTKMGRAPRDGEMMHVVGNFSGVAAARRAMDIDWMTRDELRESIPPAYTEFLGRNLLSHVEQSRAA